MMQTALALCSPMIRQWPRSIQLRYNDVFWPKYCNTNVYALINSAYHAWAVENRRGRLHPWVRRSKLMAPEAA